MYYSTLLIIICLLILTDAILNENKRKSKYTDVQRIHAFFLPIFAASGLIFGVLSLIFGWL